MNFLIKEEIIKKMFDAAKSARQNAYAPYSHFFVGAAVLSSSDKIYSGCNVENVSYSLATCAEQSAISEMIKGGDKEIKAILVMGDAGKDLVSPCGACRQRIREFAKNNIPVYICGLEGVRKETSIDELLPLSFGPEKLLEKNN